MAAEAGSPDNKRAGCGLCAAFGRRRFWSKRSPVSCSIPTVVESDAPSEPPAKLKATNNRPEKVSASPQIQKGRKTPDNSIANNHPDNKVSAFTQFQQNQNGRKTLENSIANNSPQIHQNQNGRPKTPDVGTKAATPTSDFAYVNQGKRVPKEVIGISGELENIIPDYQKSKGTANLVRASSGNVMLMGNLGNLRQSCTGGPTNSNSDQDQKKPNPNPNGNYPNSGIGNVVKKPAAEEKRGKEEPASLCRALSTRMDPEKLKIMGNEDYKNGNYAEALALYDAAISIDPNKASYWSNKSAALTAMGRLLEALFECREAIKIDPRYHRAHHRLANLHLRLGEVEKAIYHYKHAGPEADPDDMAKAKAVKLHLDKCSEAKRLKDWNSLIKATWDAINCGADSAPQIFALQAEALLKLRRHQEADEALALLKGPNFSVDDCTKFFGPIGNAILLVVRAQVDIAAGRFDDATAAIERAARLDSNNKEVSTVMRRAKAVSLARFNGNEMFKASKFTEACKAYGEGLDHDPYNSLLLCNRAACRSKLGLYENAVEDCTAALNLRPGYSKARLRRADCYAKLEKWEYSVQDYEILRKEMPDDEEVNRALSEAKLRLKN